jgi:hypothetical protein
MPAVIPALIGAAASIGGAALSSSAAGRAADAQTQASQLGVAEQRAAREEMRGLMQPFLESGNEGLGAYMNLLGLGEQGAAGQTEAVAGIENNPIFQALLRQGEQGMLQNASATGGLRGGNMQGALAQFRPGMLNQQINQQMDRYSNLATMGQNAAAGVGTAGMQSASSIASLLGEAGAARAGGALASGNAWGSALGGIGGMMASPYGMKALGKMF